MPQGRSLHKYIDAVLWTASVDVRSLWQVMRNPLMVHISPENFLLISTTSGLTLGCQVRSYGKKFSPCQNCLHSFSGTNLPFGIVGATSVRTEQSFALVGGHSIELDQEHDTIFM